MFSEKSKRREQRPFLFKPPYEMPKINFSIVHIAKKNTTDLTAMFSQRKAKDKRTKVIFIQATH